MEAFLGLLTCMGVLKSPRLEMYWSIHDTYLEKPMLLFVHGDNYNQYIM